MEDNGFITAEQAEAAKKQELRVRTGIQTTAVRAEYVAETVRQLVFAQYGDEAYTRGLNVFTTVKASEQEAAYRALRKGIMDYEKRQIYRGPERFVDLPSDPKELEDAIDDALADNPDNGDVLAAVVLEVNPKKIVAVRCNGDHRHRGRGPEAPRAGLSGQGPPKIKIRRGAVIRVMKTPKDAWEITQIPEVEGAFVALDPRDGSIHALVGGFDFNKNKFNHVTQAWRQPGSGFKPFIYSAALEKGFRPPPSSTTPRCSSTSGVTGGQPWEPKNYDGKFEGPMPLHTALAKSKNMVSIRCCRRWVPRTRRTGSPASASRPRSTGLPDHGAGRRRRHADADGPGLCGVRQWRLPRQSLADHAHHRPEGQAAGGKPAAAAQRGGARHRRPQCLHHEPAAAGDHASGTAARAQARLKRADLYGKTGTTNDSIDTWFNGFHPDPGGGGLDGLRHAALAGRPRDRRRPEPAGLDQLHGGRAQGRAGDGAERPKAW